MTKTNKQRDADRRTAAAARVAEMQRQQQTAERRRRALVITASVVAVIVIVVGAVVLIKNHQSPKQVASQTVSGTTSSYGIVVGKSTAPVKMVAYEDFQCPFCEQFESTSGATVSKYIDNGTLSVQYRPIAFLDQESSTNYSTRALNAAACVVNYTNSDTFKKFHDLLYQHQPAEQSAGLPNSQLVTYAKQAGAGSTAVANCINNGTFNNWTASATLAASKSPVMSQGLTTPTVLIDGNPVQSTVLLNPTALASTIQAAAKNKP
ncbi:MAG: DsbA family protein [Nocardioidaceae bacterium]